MRIGVLMAVMSVGFAANAAAQDRSIPRDLVLGLFAHEIAFDSASTLEILVGKAPDDLLLPKLNLQVIGALKHGLGATIVYRVAGDPRKAYEVAKEQFRTAGWREPSVPELPEVGFIGTEVRIQELMPMCRDNAMAMLQPATIRSDLRILKVDLYHAEGCSDANAVGWTQFGGLTEKTPLPKLEPPQAAQVYGSPIPATVSSFITNAFVVSEMTTGQLVDHYGAQMRAAGWSSGGGTTGENVSVRTWRLPADGTEWLATMAVTQLPERRHVVEISVYNLSRLTR